MKISKLQKLAGVFFALALGTTTLFAQGSGNGNRVNNNQNGNCLQQISGLTEKQQTEIQTMEQSHQKEMAELRDNRRGTVDAIEKNEIRGEMLKKVQAHQNAVKNLLTADQQKEYDNLHAQRNNYQGTRGRNHGQQFANNNRGGCQRNGAGYGNGNRGNRGQKGNGCQRNRGGKGKKGYGRRAGMNTAGGRGYGRGYYSAQTDIIENTKVN